MLLSRMAPARLIGLQKGNKSLDRHPAEVFSLTGTNGNLLRRDFLVAYDDLERQLLQTMFSNFMGNFKVSQVGDRAYAGFSQRGKDGFAVIRLPFRNIHDHHLYRREPYRQR